MTPRELLARLRELDVTIDPLAGQLHPNSPDQELPRELQLEWEQHQEEIARILELEQKYRSPGHGAALSRPPTPRNKTAFWQEVLGSELPILELPYDRPRPAILGPETATAKFFLPSNLTQRLRDLAAAHDFSLDLILLTAFQVVLFRYSRQPVQLIGASLAGATTPQNESGSKNAPLPLKIEIAPEADFWEMANTSRHSYRSARDHQVSFDTLIEILDISPPTDRHPVYQVQFETQPKSTRANRKSRAAVGTPPDLQVSAQVGKTVGLTVTYSTDLFDPETIQRFAGHYKTLLTDLWEHPEKPIRRLEILTPLEKQQILVDWNRTRAAYPEDQCLHQLFASRAAQSPDAIAVIDAREQLTYREVNERANRLAHYLQHLGVQPEQFVGICLDRGVDMLVALFGVMKAGAAYLPLDPAFPRDRLRFMLADADVKILLTREHLADILKGATVKRVFLDCDREKIAEFPATPPAVSLTPDHLLYVIYTSGSTGKPKGVQISHRAAVNFLISMGEKPGLAAGDTLLSVTTLSFDIAVLELYLPLLKGARVVIAGRDVAMDGTQLKIWLLKHQATVMQATPATWRLLLEAGWHPRGPFKALCGGEPIPQKLCDTLLARGVELWNMYGPTETTVWSTCERMHLGQALITIGRPIANTQIFILDNDRHPVPVGVTGELFIGGDGLSRGYLNRKGLTAERFQTLSLQEWGLPERVRDQCQAAWLNGQRDSIRLYKTGDLARYRRDGRIECLGRTDFQVKIRGFRIELGEIETLLNRHPGVKEGVVVAREDTRGHKQLAAYVVAKQRALTIGALREFLTHNLPDYMVPTRYIFLEQMPLTPNGKIDRQSLPAPETAPPQAIARPAARPRNQLERQLTEIFQDVLKTRPVGIHDHFFEIGGHSLLAPRLFARIEEVTGKNLPLAVLFKAPTVAQLAQEIREHDGTKAWSSLVPIHPEGPRPPLFCIHGAGGNVLIYRDLANYLGTDQPVYGLQSQGLDGSGKYYTTFEEMAAHYIREIRTVQPAGPYYLSGYCLGGTIALEMAQQLLAEGEAVAMVAMFETYNVQKFNPLALPAHQKGLRLLQNIYFHWQNFNLLSSDGRRQFLRDKWAVSRQRLMERLSLVRQSFRGKQAATDVSRYPHMLLGRINDAAEVQYQPRPYPGRITLFCPEARFWGEEDPLCGWGDIARGGVDLQKLPLFPRGMMVDPFVQLLAIRLRACMDRARAGREVPQT